MKSGLIILNEIERNVLQVALDRYMEEHLMCIGHEVDVVEELKACRNLQSAVK